MSLLLKKGWFLWLLATLFIVSCRKEYSCESCIDASSKGKKPPIAKAGADQIIRLPASEFYLDGSSSTDADNNISSYAWTLISGASTVTIAHAHAVQTSVRNFVPGTYSFELTVTDTDGLFSKDTVVIAVTDREIEARWTRLQPVPEHEFFAGNNYINFLVAIEERLFAVSKIGGFWQYDMQENKWTKKGDLPTQLAATNFSVVFSIGHKGYFIGNGTCRQYDVRTGGWVTKNNAPIGADHIDYSVPLVIGGKAYLVGKVNKLVTMYDPVTDSYTQKNNFPDPGAEAGFVINGEGYIVQQNGRCWKYDALTDSWQQKTGLPSSVYHMSGLTLNGYGYIIGDLNRNAYHGNGGMKVWRYDPAADQWKLLDEEYPGKGVYEIRTASMNGIAYVGLGYSNNNRDAVDFWSFK